MKQSPIVAVRVRGQWVMDRSRLAMAMALGCQAWQVLYWVTGS